MKKLILALLVLTSIYARGQNPPVIKPGLPAPKLKPLLPADLLIVNTALVSAEWNTTLKTWVVKVNVTIKNAGQLASPAGILIGMVRRNNTSQWTRLANSERIDAINPGSAITKDYTFIDKNNVLKRSEGFGLMVKADPENTIKEVNETNNESTVINVPTPSR